MTVKEFPPFPSSIQFSRPFDVLIECTPEIFDIYINGEVNHMKFNGAVSQHFLA